MSWSAASWTAAAFAVLTLPFMVLLTGEVPAGRGFWWDFSMGLGFGALAMFALQFALTARFRRMTQPFGIDALYLFHRFMALGAVTLALGHFAILYLGYQEALGVLNPLESDWELTAGRLAMLCFLVIVVSSEFRKRLRLEYGLWRHLHAGLAALGFVAAIAHVLGIGNYTGTAGTAALWLGVTLGFLGLLVWVRVVKPWHQLREPWRVAENRKEQGGAHTLVLEPVGHAGIGSWLPGQFAWLTLNTSPFFLREHPFTIANTPTAAPRIEFSIRPAGDFTHMTETVAAGTTAYLDGPYGVFSIDRHRDAAGFVMVAGGIGITPILANLRAMAERGDRRPATLLFGNPDWESIPFRDELALLEGALDLTLVHVLQEPPEGWQGEAGLIDADLLDRHLTSAQVDWPHFLCGPVPMVSAVDAALRRRGVPLHHIHNEIFELA